MDRKKDLFFMKHKGKTVDELYQMRSSMASNDAVNNKQEIIEMIEGMIKIKRGKKTMQQVIGGDSKAPKFTDLQIAEKYIVKSQNAEYRGIDFLLSFADYKRLMARKTCAYTGVSLVDNGESSNPRLRTIDRIDSLGPYSKENCVACTLAANRLKNQLFEIPEGGMRMDIKALLKFAASMKKMLLTQ